MSTCSRQVCWTSLQSNQNYAACVSRGSNRSIDSCCPPGAAAVVDRRAAPAPARGGGMGAWPPTEKCPLGDCTERPITCPSYALHTLLKRSYSTRTTMKRTNFSRRFDKPDLNFHNVYTHSQSSGHILIQSEIITHIKIPLSFIFQHSKKPAKYKKKRVKLQNRIISKLLSKSFFVNLPTQELQKKLCLNV